MAKKGHKRLPGRDEPGRDDDACVEFGGERIWAVDFTAGGAPIGLTEEEFRSDEFTDDQEEEGWALARRALREVISGAAPKGAEVSVGWVQHLGGGLTVRAWRAEVSVSPDPDGLQGAWVARVPRQDAPPRPLSVQQEAALLRRLSACSLPFRTPQDALVAVGQAPILAYRLVSGIPLDLRAGRGPFKAPWETPGQVAASIHALPVAVGDGLLTGAATRREEALRWVCVLDELDDRAGTDGEPAREWAREHLPPAEPASLLHGDLLGQNLLIDPTDERPLGVIDWSEARFGDPALDLAIVTRGAKRPFGTPDGLKRLIEAYAEAGGRPLTVSDVHLYELCLTARWLLDALARYPVPTSAQSDLGRFRGVLRRALGG